MPDRIRSFWQRLGDGISIQQLWGQFRADAVTSYHLYSKEVPSQIEAESPWKRLWRAPRGLFWAIMMKLSPGRRVLLLIALVILFLPDMRIAGQWDMGCFRFWAGMIWLALLALELADRVTMKRDPEIAREIQRWLMPSAPPDVPGVDIAFVTRPANTVAGDYYDAFFRRTLPHFGPYTFKQVHSRSESESSSFLYPHSAHRFVDGKNRSTWTKCLLFYSALYATWRSSSPNAASSHADHGKPFVEPLGRLRFPVPAGGG